jgi:hypothetical protein
MVCQSSRADLYIAAGRASAAPAPARDLDPFFKRVSSGKAVSSSLDRAIHALLNIDVTHQQDRRQIAPSVPAALSLESRLPPHG